MPTDTVTAQKRYFTCRGIELLKPQVGGLGMSKCPAENFEICANGAGFKTWTRVCSVHETITLPRTRSLVVNMPALTKVNHDKGLTMVRHLFILCLCISIYACEHMKM